VRGSADFPVIVAYNGHRAGVGRVVVDSTFHHFVNINVTGVKSEFSDEPDPATPTNAQGFPASAAGQAAYEKIKAYWRNIASWIAPPAVLKRRAWQMFRDVALDPRLKQTVPLGDAARVPARLLTRYGAAAWSLMLRRASTCTVISWAIDTAIPDPLSYLLAYPVYVKLTLPDPPPEEQIRRDLAVDKLELIHYALGAAMLGLRQPEAQELLQSGSLGRLDAERGVAIVQRGALAGVRRGLRDQAARMERTLTAMRRALALSERVGSEVQREERDVDLAAGALAAGSHG